jgi:hypothetical protein
LPCFALPCLALSCLIPGVGISALAGHAH